MKRINIKNLIIFTLTTILVVILFSCMKEDLEISDTLRYLYSMYENGSIDECKHN